MHQIYQEILTSKILYLTIYLKIYKARTLRIFSPVGRLKAAYEIKCC